MPEANKPRHARRTSQFKSDLKGAKKHTKCDFERLMDTMIKIASRERLDAALLDHPLKGRYPDRKDGATDCRECHTSNDWLLVYRYPDDESVVFIRTGTHSEIFS